MKAPNIIGGVLVIGLSIAGLAVFGNSITPKAERALKIEEVARQLTPRAEVIPQENSPAEKSENLTDKRTQEISRKIADNITNLNAQGLTEIDNEQFIEALNPQKVISEVLREELLEIETMARTEKKPIIIIKNEKIIKNADKGQQENYLQLFKNTLNQYEAEIITNSRNVNSPDDFGVFINAYQQAIDRFYQMQVPDTLLDFHKQELALLIQQKAIWEKLKNVTSDPLEAIVALRHRDNAVQEFNNLQANIGQYIKNNNLAVQWP